MSDNYRERWQLERVRRKRRDTQFVEKDAKIKELNNLFAIQQTRMDKATKLWQEATGKTETLPDLGALLDWLMTRGTEAERIHREMIDLLEVITGESSETYPEMAVTDAVRLLKKEKEEAERKLRAVEWLKSTWSEFDEPLDAECNLPEPAETIHMIAADWCSKLKTATDALKKAETAMDHMLHDVTDKEPFREAYDVVKKALADIEGEKKELGNELDKFEISQETEEEYKKRLSIKREKVEEVEPDWKTIEADAKGKSIEMLAGSCYEYQAKALLYLRDKLSKLEGRIYGNSRELPKKSNP